MKEKVVYEVKLSKPVMAIASVAALGLLLIGLKPVLEVTPAFANSGIQKVAICDEQHGKCVSVARTASQGLLLVNNALIQ